MNALLRGGPTLKVRTRDGLNCGILEFKEIEVLNDDGTVSRYGMEPSSGEDDTDGASVPAPGQIVGLDHYGVYWSGAVTHDLLFRRRLVQWLDGQWRKLIYVESGADPAKGEMDFSRANQIFRALMFGLGTDHAKATIIYDALVVLGRRAWDEDAAAAPIGPGNQ